LRSEVKLAPVEALLGEIEGEVWTLPAKRMKGGKEHRVPLSAPAMVIVPSAGKTDDAPEQEWFQYWNADLAPVSCWR
jgi:hypothetical protein